MKQTFVTFTCIYVYILKIYTLYYIISIPKKFEIEEIDK